MINNLSFQYVTVPAKISNIPEYMKNENLKNHKICAQSATHELANFKFGLWIPGIIQKSALKKFLVQRVLSL